MAHGQSGASSILALLPFLVKGALALAILREMRTRGLNVTVAYFLEEAVGYTRDSAEDFQASDDLIALSGIRHDQYLKTLQSTVVDRQIGVILQIGAFPAYEHLPYLKERFRGLQILDMLYNEVGHTLNHFLFEACFDAALVESEHMRRFVQDRTLKEDPDIRVLESGIDLDEFSWSESAGSDQIVLGYLGRMSPEKNPLGFVEIAKSLQPKLPNLVFRMYGEGSMADEVRRRIDEAGLGEVVHFEGYVGHSRDALRQMDVLVVPSKLDGRPNVIMEANACGVPVIGAPVGGIPELIEPNRNGFLHHPDDFEGFTATIDSLERDRNFLMQLRQSSRRHAEQRFAREEMMKRYVALFQDFLARASNHSGH